MRGVQPEGNMESSCSTGHSSCIYMASLVTFCLDLIYDAADLYHRPKFKAHILEHHLTLEQQKGFTINLLNNQKKKKREKEEIYEKKVCFLICKYHIIKHNNNP